MDRIGPGGSPTGPVTDPFTDWLSDAHVRSVHESHLLQEHHVSAFSRLGGMPGATWPRPQRRRCCGDGGRIHAWRVHRRFGTDRSACRRCRVSQRLRAFRRSIVTHLHRHDGSASRTYGEGRQHLSRARGGRHLSDMPRCRCQGGCPRSGPDRCDVAAWGREHGIRGADRDVGRRCPEAVSGADAATGWGVAVAGRRAGGGSLRVGAERGTTATMSTVERHHA